MCMHTQMQRQGHTLIHKSICTDTRIKTEKKVIHTKDITRTHTQKSMITHMQTLIQTAVACIKIVIDKQCFLFPCWSCNALLFCSCCTTSLSLPPPFPSFSVSSILCSTILLLLSVSHPPSLPHPHLQLASSHHLPLPFITFAYLPLPLQYLTLAFPFSLCRPLCLQSDTAPYSSGKVFFLLFTLSANLSHSLSSSLYFMSQHNLISLSSHFDLSILTLSYLSFLHLLLLIHYRHYCSFFFTFGCFSNIHLP